MIGLGPIYVKNLQEAKAISFSVLCLQSLGKHHQFILIHSFLIGSIYLLFVQYALDEADSKYLIIFYGCQIS